MAATTKPRYEEPPYLCRAGAPCVGCGRVKKYLGKPASSLICCDACWDRIPAAMRERFLTDDTRVGGDPGASDAEEAIAFFLRDMREPAHAKS